MDIRGTRRHVDEEIVEFAPVGIVDKLLQGIGGHRPAPEHRGVLVDKESYRQQFHAIALKGDDEVAPVDFVHEQVLILDAEHLRLRRAENIGIEQTHLVPLAGKGYRKVGGDGRLPHATFARRYTDDILHPGKRTGCRRRGGLGHLHADIALYLHLGRDVSLYGGLGRAHQRLDKRVGRTVENKREAHLVAVNAYVVGHHPGLNYIFTRRRIAHILQRVQYQVRIKSFHYI